MNQSYILIYIFGSDKNFLSFSFSQREHGNLLLEKVCVFGDL
jgi:hypothetical protein